MNWVASFFLLVCCVWDFLKCLLLARALTRACAEQALSMLNGTQLGGQSVRLSWGRSPSSKQVLIYFHLSYIPCFDSCFCVTIYLINGIYRLSQISPSGMVHIMDMHKDTRHMGTPHLLKTQTCTMEAILDMEITNSRSR